MNLMSNHYEGTICNTTTTTTTTSNPSGWDQYESFGEDDDEDSKPPGSRNKNTAIVDETKLVVIPKDCSYRTTANGVNHDNNYIRSSYHHCNIRSVLILSALIVPALIIVVARSLGTASIGTSAHSYLRSSSVSETAVDLTPSTIKRSMMFHRVIAQNKGRQSAQSHRAESGAATTTTSSSTTAINKEYDTTVDQKQKQREQQCIDTCRSSLLLSFLDIDENKSSVTSTTSYSSKSQPYYNPEVDTDSEGIHPEFFSSLSSGRKYDRHLQEASSNPFASLPTWFQWVMVFVLLVMSAIFSGLTLGFLGLDITGLQVIIGSDDKVQAGYATKVLPIRKYGNLLLCTLILGNVAVNSLLSILMADKAGGIVGFITSTLSIVVFGEIFPQAACARYPLYVGSKAAPLVKVIVCLLYPITKPLAALLDCILGQELLTIYNEAEMLKLLQIHVQENALDKETAATMGGALKYKNIAVGDVMTPLENVFMIPTDAKLDFQLLATIFKSGYSRIPIYEISKNNVVGLLFVKDLIFLDPEDAVRVVDFVEIFGRTLHVVWQDDKLGDVLRELKSGKSHMALVRDVASNPNNPDADPYYEITGIITLEDIIEEILGDEIVDETDTYLDGSHSMKVNRNHENRTFDWARLRSLDAKIVDEALSIDEVKAVVAHLQKNYSSVVSLISEKQLHRLVSESPVVLYDPVTASTDLESSSVNSSTGLPKDLLYEKGVPADSCLLILSGKISVVVGEENFHTDVSSWYLLAPRAVEVSSYVPDFSAYVSGDSTCRCLQITQSKFAKAIDASTFERIGHPTTSHPVVNNSHHNRTGSWSTVISTNDGPKNDATNINNPVYLNRTTSKDGNESGIIIDGALPLTSKQEERIRITQKLVETGTMIIPSSTATPGTNTPKTNSDGWSSMAKLQASLALVEQQQQDEQQQKQKQEPQSSQPSGQQKVLLERSGYETEEMDFSYDQELQGAISTVNILNSTGVGGDLKDTTFTDDDAENKSMLTDETPFDEFNGKDDSHNIDDSNEEVNLFVDTSNDTSNDVSS